MVTLNSVKLRDKCERRVQRGYLWVFSNEIIDRVKDYKPGELVRVTRSDGKFLGIGYINPQSLIAIRILSHEQRLPDYNFFLEKILNAKNRREVFLGDRSVYRIVFSESDLLPGLILDRYDQYILIQSTTVGMDQLIPVVTEVVRELFKPRAILFRNDRVIQEQEHHVSRRDVLEGMYSGPIDLKIDNFTYRIDLLTGQKTGFYLDQLSHYKDLESISKHASVLDTCCYTGGFGIHAAYYGADQVVGIDISDEALVNARINADLNGVSGKCQFIKGSAFDELRSRIENREQYDIIILDPPSFTRSKNKLNQALKGYKELHVKAMRLLRSGGYLLTFSCSHHVPVDRFIQMVAEAARNTNKVFQIVRHYNQPPDHPSLLTMPETNYFKGLILRQI